MIPLFKVHMPSSVMGPLKKTLSSGYIGQGKKVDEFERMLGPLVANTLVLTTNSCTSSIHLALRLAGVGPGTEVVTTPQTCSATNQPILERGAKIVWADIDPKTGLLDVASVTKKMTGRTRAVICVDWGGTPCSLDPLRLAAESHGALLIEDAAHSLGAVYKRHEVGAHAHITCFSFQAIKTLTTGDGGAMTFLDRSLYERAKLLRWFGIDRTKPDAKGSHSNVLIPEYGYKFAMNDIAATIGIEQMKYVGEIIRRHRHVASYYHFHIKDMGIKSIVPVPVAEDRIPSYWLYTVLCEDRDGFMAFMESRGVACSIVHRRNDEHPCFASANHPRLPGVDEFASRQCAIPCGWWIDDDAMRYIVRIIGEYEESRNRRTYGSVTV